MKTIASLVMFCMGMLAVPQAKAPAGTCADAVNSVASTWQKTASSSITMVNNGWLVACSKVAGDDVSKLSFCREIHKIYADGLKDALKSMK